MNPFFMFAAMTAGGLLGGITGLIWVSRRVARSRFLTRRYANLSYGEKKCTHCTVGTQILAWHEGDGELEISWGPIPESLHIVRKGHRFVGSRQANVRPCTTCNATSRVPTLLPGMIDQGHVEYRK